MTNLTPAEHCAVRARAYLMFARHEAGWRTQQPTALVQDPPRKQLTRPRPGSAADLAARKTRRT